jgi:hypothetical protein
MILGWVVNNSFLTPCFRARAASRKGRAFPHFIRIKKPAIDDSRFRYSLHGDLPVFGGEATILDHRFKAAKSVYVRK